MTGRMTDPPIAFAFWNAQALAETRTTIEITNSASFVAALVDGDERRAVEDLDALDEAFASQHAAHICHRHRVAGASHGHHRGLADHDRPGHRRRERVDGQRIKGRGLDLPAPRGAWTSKG
jgi:hypothetical protein